MWTVESEIEEALVKLNLSEDELRKCSPEEAFSIQKKVMQLYVEGNPRSWWMGLKKPHLAYDYDFPSDYITVHMPKSESRVWWIPETEKENLCVYDVIPNVISRIMEQVAQFEYYVVGRDLDWIIIETDHGQLWVVNE